MPMPIYYEDEDKKPISVGDLVTYGGEPGVVAFVIQEKQFSPGYPEEEWSYLEKGIGIKLENGEFFCLDEPDEDLALRKGPAKERQVRR
jgi:hypothetical protein